MNKRILTGLSALVIAPGLALGTMSTASAATSGDTLVAAAKKAAYASCKGFETEPLVPLERVKGGVNYAGLLVCHRGQDNDNGLVFDVKAIVIPTERSAGYRHDVTIYADELYDGKGAKKKTDDRRTGTLTWSFNDVVQGADMTFWATQDVKGTSKDAVSKKVLVDYLS